MRNLIAEVGKAYLITDVNQREYFSGATVAEGVLIMADKSYYFTDARYFCGVEAEIKANGLVPMLYEGEKDLKNLLFENGVKTLLIDYTKTTVSDYNKYKEMGYELEDCSAQLVQLMAVKSEEEIILIKKACDIAYSAFSKVAKTIKPGVTEIEVADRLLAEMKALGADGSSFDIIVAFGKNTAVPHHKTGKEKLKKGMPVLIDMGASYKGYKSDITRMLYCGQPDEDFSIAYEAVLKANKIAIDNITDGMTAKQADLVARNYLETMGLDKFFTHSLGHGIGKEIHEYPFLSPKSDSELVNGNVFTVEPGVYFSENFGIRIEDTVVLHEGEVVRLYNDDKQLIIIK